MVKKKTKITLNDISQKIDLYRAEVVSMKVDLTEEIAELKEKISHLPTKEEFYNKKDLYDTTTKRIEIIDDKLGINSLTLSY